MQAKKFLPNPVLGTLWISPQRHETRLIFVVVLPLLIPLLIPLVVPAALRLLVLLPLLYGSCKLAKVSEPLSRSILITIFFQYHSLIPLAVSSKVIFILPLAPDHPSGSNALQPSTSSFSVQPYCSHTSGADHKTSLLRSSSSTSHSYLWPQAIRADDEGDVIVEEVLVLAQGRLLDKFMKYFMLLFPEYLRPESVCSYLLLRRDHHRLLVGAQVWLPALHQVRLSEATIKKPCTSS